MLVTFLLEFKNDSPFWSPAVD